MIFQSNEQTLIQPETPQNRNQKKSGLNKKEIKIKYNPLKT